MTAWQLYIISLPLFFSLGIAQTDSVSVVQDSMFAVPLLNDLQRTKGTIKEYKNFEPTKKPWLAVGLSAVVPGAGQIYNETYWKLPIIWGLGGYWIYEWVDLNKQYKNFQSQYSEGITPALPDGDQQTLRLRDFYRDERDKFAWFLGGLYFLNLVDAYVGAHLYDFNVSPDLSEHGAVVPKVTATIHIPF